ncbi:MAG TPA: MarR family transcriptional regulator [Tepidisphaeraceae bacterium]|jgi:DNA-binding MarR family transcriptional regulator
MSSRPTPLPQARPEALQTWLRLARVYQKIQRRLDRILSNCDITLPQFDVLANLGMSDGITQQELAGRLLVTKGNVCGLLDRMEAAELVERKPSPNDRRANHLHLTAKGRAALQAAFPIHLGLIEQCMAPLTATDQARLNSLLNKIESSDCAS